MPVIPEEIRALAMLELRRRLRAEVGRVVVLFPPLDALPEPPVEGAATTEAVVPAAANRRQDLAALMAQYKGRVL